MRQTTDITEQSYGDLVAARLSRRVALQGLAAGIAGAWVGGLHGGTAARASTPVSSLGFTELKRIYDETHHVAPGYRADVLLRWGDPLFADSPAFDPATLTAAAQEKLFGYNCDFIGYVPLPAGDEGSAHGLLCVNHEYISANVMFPGMTEDDAGKLMTEEQVAIGLAAMGHSVVEIVQENGRWRYVRGSPYNRRLTANTPMRVSGPAAGNALLKTSADATGTMVLGTSYNCAGGVTPWGTVLTCEEGCSDLFGGDAAKAANPALLERYGYDGSDIYGRGRFHDRFVLDKEPNEPNRFDWVVEIDPYDAASTPVKRTALGRTSHEGATPVVNHDGRLVVYMGDDDYFEYIYRFVSAKPWNPSDRAANRDLLDDGTLSVARIEADGTLRWLPLVFGEGPLTAANGFADQAELLIKTRLAADLVGATKMDRPEGFTPNPVTGRVYAVMTKNSKRPADGGEPANPRGENKWGHILELTPPGQGAMADHAADTYQWDVFLLAGDPSDPAQKASYNPGVSADGWLVNPDNITFDPKGRIWIATDGANDFDLADGLYAADTEGDGRALTKLFFASPHGAEVTGPCFAPDGKSLFLSVQHPGEDAETLDKVATRWPDFDPNVPPRPSVVVLKRDDGGEIGA